MRAVALATLVASAALAQPIDKCSDVLYRNTAACRNGAAFELALQSRFAVTGTLPACTGDSACVASCYVSTGTTWVCKDNAGADMGNVQQGTTPTAEDTFAPQMRARSNVSDSTAPTASGTTFSNLLAGDLTIICAGIWHANGSTANSSYVSIGHATDLDNVMSMYAATGTITCGFGEGGAFPTGSTGASAMQEGWAVVSCRRSGNNRIARSNGSDGVTVSTAATRGIDAGLTVGFGRERPGATGRNLAGPLAFCNFYSESKTATWLRGAENAFWGVSLDAGGGLSGLIGLPNDAGTHVDFFSGGAHVVSPDRGLRTVGQSGDNINGKWAADPFDVSSWTDVGTPLVGESHIPTEPFARWKKDGGCWNLEDNDGAAFEGKVSAELQRSTASGAFHGWNMRVWAAIGDAGTTRDKMRVTVLSPTGPIVSDGGTEEYCDFTLDGTVRPYDCPAYTGDAGVTTVKGRVLVGNTAATTGSITVCHAQDTAHVYPQLVVANATAFGASSEAIDPAPWPSTALKGKYEVVFTPLHDISGAQWDQGNNTLYLFDAHDAVVEHNVVVVGGYQQAGRILARTTKSGNATEFNVDNQSLTAGQRYAVSMEWRPTHGGHCRVWLRLNPCYASVASCHANTIIAKSVSGSGWCPGQPVAVRLGNRYDDTVPTSVFVDAVRVYQ